MDEFNISSVKTAWYKKIDWWELIVTVAPVCIGIGIVAILLLVDKLSPGGASTDWTQRILFGMAGVIAGISLQFKGISREFSKIRDQSNRNTKKLAEELSEAIGIPVEAATSDRSLIRRTYRIAERSSLIDKRLEHLSSSLHGAVRSWVETYLSDVDSTVSRLAQRRAHFDGIKGLEADEDLISHAQNSTLATVPVSKESFDFWSSASAKKYRESVSHLIERFPEFRESTDELGYFGVARIFTFPLSIISDAEDSHEEAMRLVEQAVEEAQLQKSIGVEVRMLLQEDLGDSELGELDVLIVDGSIASKTVSQDQANAQSRSVVVTWERTAVERLSGDWRLIWRRAVSIDEFLEDERLSGIREWMKITREPLEEKQANSDGDVVEKNASADIPKP